MTCCWRRSGLYFFRRILAVVFSITQVASFTTHSTTSWVPPHKFRPISSWHRTGWLIQSSNCDMPERRIENRHEKLSIEGLVSDAMTGMTIDESVMSAAAAVTQKSCELLGIKSIGVDYGLSRTGVAVTVGYDPKPLAIVSETNATEVAKQVVKYCAAEQAKRIVIGLPLHKNGTEAPQSNLTREFASELACCAMARLGSSVSLYLWDERYTSKEAAARVHSQDPDEWLHGTLDGIAACIILENYYKENGEGAERVLIPKDLEGEVQCAWEAQQRKEARRSQSINDQREANLRKRQEAMERARKLEAQMKRDGTLGTSNKKKKKKKRKREKRGTWQTFK